MNFGGRKEIFRALVGSHNYNMNTKESDKDYKIFVAPTFDDLYFNKSYSDSKIGATEDYDIHDVRKLSNLLWKSNVNFMEVLFSEDIVINEDISSATRDNLNWILDNRQAIARINLPYLFNACIGMHINKLKLINKCTEGTKHLYEKYGYDTKSAMHSVRILFFLERFYLYGFKDFKKSVWLHGADREFLLSIKNGTFSKEAFEKYAKGLKVRIESSYKDNYYNEKPNEGLNEELILRLKEIVRNEL